MQYKNLLFVTALAVSAAASPLEARADVWKDFITSPKKGDVWCVGKDVKVTWNTNDIPASWRNSGRIVLEKADNEKFDKELVSKVDLKSGSYTVKVPTVDEGIDYYVAIGFNADGVKGMVSGPKFTIQQCLKREVEDEN